MGYHHVLSAGRAAGEDTDALRQRLLGFLHRQEHEVLGRQSTLSPGWQRARQGPAVLDVSLRAEVLGSEGRWVEACLLAQPPAACRDAVLNSIAVHLPAEQHEQAVQLLLRVFEAVIQRSSSPYRDALALVDEIGQRMDTVRRAAWLDQLRTQYKVKRNFVRDLPER